MLQLSKSLLDAEMKRAWLQLHELDQNLAVRLEHVWRTDAFASRVDHDRRTACSVHIQTDISVHRRPPSL